MPRIMKNNRLKLRSLIKEAIKKQNNLSSLNEENRENAENDRDIIIVAKIMNLVRSNMDGSFLHEDDLEDDLYDLFLNY